MSYSTSVPGERCRSKSGLCFFNSVSGQAITSSANLAMHRNLTSRVVNGVLFISHLDTSLIPVVSIGLSKLATSKALNFRHPIS